MNVSRETSEKFERYQALLSKWQRTINLVSVETLPDIGTRHFVDSYQLIDFIPSTAKSLCDWGSGAGFPGLVIAMARPDLDITLIDSDQRKCAFLRVVSRETQTKVKILDDRVDAVVRSVDLVTARAFAPLKDILRLGLAWVQENPALKFLLLKGQTAEAEILEARQAYDFDVQIFSSRTDPAASILLIEKLALKS